MTDDKLTAIDKLRMCVDPDTNTAPPDMADLLSEVEALEAKRDALRDALESMLGYIDTPISRRRLSLKSEHPEWLTEARRVMRDTLRKDNP